MSGGIAVKFKYFDEGSSSWTERKSAPLAGGSANATSSGGGGNGGNGNTPLKYNATLCNVDVKSLDASELERFHELLALHCPAVAILHNVTTATLTRLKGNVFTKKTYALLESSRSEQYEECTVMLLRLGLQCEPTEASLKSEGRSMLRALLHMYLRLPNNGPSLSITILNIDPNVTPHRRLSVATTMKYPATADVVILVNNIAEGLTHAEELYRELQLARTNVGFVDVLEECVEKAPVTAAAWSVWMKSAKYAVATASADIVKGQEHRFVAATVIARSQAAAAAAAAAASGASITIPMPRSAKGGRTKSPTSSPSTTQILTDPAVLSAEAARSGSNNVTGSNSNTVTPVTSGITQSTPTALPAGSDIILRLMRHQQQQQQQQQHQQQPRWRLAHSFAMKAGDAKPNSAEMVFDVSHLFSTPTEAVEELNANNLKWPADFCVVHNTVLCSDNVAHCDRQSFRRYARDKNNSALASKLFASTSAYAATHALEKTNATWAKQPLQQQQQQQQPSPATIPAQPQQLTRTEAEDFVPALPRVLPREDVVLRREWHESCCTIVYQTTPREMKFNITKLVGVAKDNLKMAIYLLNRSKTGTKENNVLYDYPYDYALLLSVERQGFWLIAATHVPCDIVACRMVA